jgi:hypothetical protein
LGSAAIALAAIFRGLSEQLRLQREDVIQHPIDPPALEAMVGDDARAVEMPPQQGAQRPIDPRATSDLGFLQKLQAAVEGELAEPVFANRHRGFPI